EMAMQSLFRPLGRPPLPLPLSSSVVSVVSSPDSVVVVFFSVVDEYPSLDLADACVVGAVLVVSSLAPQALMMRRIPAMTWTMRRRRMRFLPDGLLSS